MPGYGLGINYEYGLFKQEIRNNQQVERPDTWRAFPSPWEIERPQDAVLVPLYGHIEHGVDRHGNYNPMWADCYCMFYRFPGSNEEWERRSGRENRDEQAEAIQHGEVSGLLAYVDDKPVAWCHAAKWA